MTTGAPPETVSVDRSSSASARVSTRQADIVIVKLKADKCGVNAQRLWAGPGIEVEAVNDRRVILSDRRVGGAPATGSSMRTAGVASTLRSQCACRPWTEVSHTTLPSTGPRRAGFSAAGPCVVPWSRAGPTKAQNPRADASAGSRSSKRSGGATGAVAGLAEPRQIRSDVLPSALLVRGRWHRPALGLPGTPPRDVSNPRTAVVAQPSTRRVSIRERNASVRRVRGHGGRSGRTPRRRPPRKHPEGMRAQARHGGDDNERRHKHQPGETTAACGATSATDRTKAGTENNRATHEPRSSIAAPWPARPRRRP